MPTRSTPSPVVHAFRCATFALTLLLGACGGAGEPGERTERDEDGAKPDAASESTSDEGDAEGDAGAHVDAGSSRDMRRDAGRDGGTMVDRGRDGAAPPKDGGSAKPEGRDPLDRDAASVDAASTNDAASSDAGGSVRLPSVSSTASDGPFMPMEDLRGGPRGNSGVFRPSELGKDGLKHPVFIWGCGGSSTPSSYADQLRRVASHGFIVVAEVARIGDNGAPLKAAIDWIIAEHSRSGSPFQGHVATDRVALGGHSIGSANSFYIADDPRLTTTIHVAGGSLDNVNDPFAPTTGMGGKRIVKPVAYICSMSDTFMNVEKTSKDYDNTKAPAWMTVMTGVEHVGAARSGLPATIAWLRWHLAGEVERRAAFLTQGGEFTTGIFVSRSKNW